MKKDDYYTGTVCIDKKDGYFDFHKYRNLDPRTLARFEKFAKSKPGALYVNYYHRGIFVRRTWFREY